MVAEVLREAEDRLRAQLQAATAADQRALTIAGFQITSAIASLGGGVALARANPPDLWLSFLAIVFAAVMAISAREAVVSAQPQDFDFPGNRPEAWLPENWHSAEHGHTLAQANIEQAACLDESIEDNAESMREAGGRVRRSLKWSIGAVALSALLLFGTLVVRNWSIREPTSEVIRL